MGRLLERLACLIADTERMLAAVQNPQQERYLQAYLNGMEQSYALYLRLAQTHYTY